MPREPGLYETNKIRCISFHKWKSDDIYLTMCGVEHCLPDYIYHTDGRPAYHLHVILDGRGVLSVNGRQQELHFGQMFITKPGEDTWYKADSNDPWSYCWMSFDGNLAQKCAEDAGFLPGVNWLDCHIDRQIFFTLVSRILDRTEVVPSNLYLRTGLLLEYLSAAIDSYDRGAASPRRIREFPMDDYVRYAYDFIRTNYATAKIADVAGYIGIHRSYLTSIFKEKIGVSPQKFLMQCRLGQACELLETTDNPIQDISRQVGYDNPLTFSKTFKNFYGMSPKAYRATHNPNDADPKGGASL